MWTNYKGKKLGFFQLINDVSVLSRCMYVVSELLLIHVLNASPIGHRLNIRSQKARHYCVFLTCFLAVLHTD